MVANRKKIEIARLEDHGFEYDERKFRNVVWTAVYLALILIVIAGGAASYSQKNPNYEKLSNLNFINNADNCPKELESPAPQMSDEEWAQLVERNASGQLRVDLQNDLLNNYINYAALQRVSGLWLGLTALGACVVGVLFLWLFSTCPWIMVITTVTLMFVVPATGAAYMMIKQGESMTSVGIPLIVAAVVILIILCLLASVFPLVVKLLDKASDCIVEQPGMPFMVIVLVIALVIVIVPMVGLVWVAGQVGEIVANPASYIDRSQFGCTRLGIGISCCTFEMPGWAKAYYYFTVGMIAWTVFLVMQIKTFFVAGAAAQWYFNNEDPPAWSPTLLSMKHALTYSFGSLSLSSLVLTLLAALRALAEKIRQMNKSNSLVTCLYCFANCIISCLGKLTRFATMQMAITGQGFFSAAGSVVALLTKNSLDAFGVWWVPEFIMYSAAILASITWGLITYFTYYYTNKETEDLGTEAKYLGVAGFFLCLIILLFFVFVLLNIVDALYIAMAIDKDKGNTKRSDVHEVYNELPNVKRKQAEKEKEAEENPEVESLIA